MTQDVDPDDLSLVDDQEVEIKQEEHEAKEDTRLLRELESFNNPGTEESIEIGNQNAHDAVTRSSLKAMLLQPCEPAPHAEGLDSRNKGYRPQDDVKNTKWDRNKQFLMALQFKQLTEVIKGGSLSNLLHFMNHCTDQRHNTVEDWHPALLALTGQCCRSIPSWDEAMNGPDKAGYWKAAEVEIETLLKQWSAGMSSTENTG